MNSIIDAIREAKEVKDSFIGSGKIGKLKYSIVGDREGYTITYKGSYNSVLPLFSVLMILKFTLVLNHILGRLLLLLR